MAPTDTPASPAGAPKQPEEGFLGLSTAELAGISVTDLLNNETAIRMMLHYYKQIQNENASLKNQNNTLVTYRDAFTGRRRASYVSGALTLISNLLIGFGVAALYTPDAKGGWLLLGPGILLAVAALGFSIEWGDISRWIRGK